MLIKPIEAKAPDFHGKFFFNFELESNGQANSAVAVRYGRSGIPRPWIKVSWSVFLDRLNLQPEKSIIRPLASGLF